jgi:Fe-S-cluster-containing dehydrogenase component/CRP-like cAMP-binding protein
MTDATATWPRSVFSAALLRGLDERGRDELSASGQLRTLARGEQLYQRGDEGQALYVVAEGRLSLMGLRRGEDQEIELREVYSGDSFGEEASIGATRRATATAVDESLIAELPVAMFRRALVRAGGHEVADRFERRVRRRATAELLATLSFTSKLPEEDLELLLDAAEHRELARGDVVYRVGEPATHLWLVADGMLQLQTEDAERLRVRAYLVRGDFFGDEELLAQEPRRTTAVASGASLLISIPAAVARTVTDRNPGLLRRLRRVAEAQHHDQHQVLRDATSGETQHAFRDLYRLQVARSLLVIDLDTCVRCGHCAWSCEALHGVARLVRRGDKIVTRLGTAQTASPLMLPNSCQHCENPACMPDCPTGAIGRDPLGEVYIRDELCTGCGACAKGCPWDNIQIVPRPPGTAGPHGIFEELAVKCDLCRDYDGPACVKACPTESIFRLNPAEDLPEVARMLRQPAGGQAKPEPERREGLLIGGAAISAALGVLGIAMHMRGTWVAWRGVGYWLGVLAALCFAGLLAYAVPKRLVRLWSKKRKRSIRDVDEAAHSSRRVRSVVRPQLVVHVVLGFVATALALGHGGGAITPSTGGALSLTFFATGALGLLAALSYGIIPRRLSRIERSANLPEDYGPTVRELSDRLYGGVSGKSELVKRIFEKVLVPYLRRPLGWIALLASGRRLRDEEIALRKRIEVMLQGRGPERLAGLDELVRLVVELRALSAQRALTLLLRMWLPLHIICAVVATTLLLVHIVEALS